MQDIKELSCFYISLLRTIAIVHQSHHWLAMGDNFYGNHLLFDRIYKTAAEDSDLAAEKFIGLFGNSALNLHMQAKIMGKLLEEYTGEDLIQVSMDIENRFLKFSENIYKEIKNDGKLSLGLDDMLMSIASNREGAVYLLQQVLKSPGVDLTNDKNKMAARVHRLKEIVLNKTTDRINKLKEFASKQHNKKLEEFDPNTVPPGTVIWLKNHPPGMLDQFTDILFERGLSLFYHGPGDRYIVKALDPNKMVEMVNMDTGERYSVRETEIGKNKN
jgi:DNA-binding ferritin-like protein